MIAAAQAAARVLVIAALASLSPGQERPAPAPQPSKAMARSPSPSPLDDAINRLDRGDRSGVSLLVETFESPTTAEASKQRIASALLRARVNDRIYLDYLLETARPAVETDAPTPVVYDANGRLVPKTLNPVFIEWCRKRGLEPTRAAWDEWYGRPQKIIFLAESGDPRAYDTLLKALQSENYLFASVAAVGLARIHDPRAIREIIAAAERAPYDGATGMAMALLYFEDSEAQTAAERIICDKQLLDTYREIARTRARSLRYPFKVP